MKALKFWNWNLLTNILFIDPALGNNKIQIESLVNVFQIKLKFRRK